MKPPQECNGYGLQFRPSRGDCMLMYAAIDAAIDAASAEVHK